jgi:hypothetical protein
LGRGCRIGVHSVSNDRGREDADSARVTLQVSRFLSGAGVPHSIIGKIVATPPARITFLDNRDLAGLNVQRNNPFRKGHDLAGAIGSPKPEAVCDVNVATEPPAHAAHRSCVAPAPQVSQAP